MIDHIGLAVADMKRARAFYLNALKPLGIVVIKEVSAEETGGEAHAHFGAGGKPFFSIGTAPRSTTFTRRRSPPAGATTACPARDLTITRPTTVPSSSTPTGTTLRRSATQPHETPVLRLWGRFEMRNDRFLAGPRWLRLCR